MQNKSKIAKIHIYTTSTIMGYGILSALEENFPKGKGEVILLNNLLTRCLNFEIPDSELIIICYHSEMNSEREIIDLFSRIPPVIKKKSILYNYGTKSIELEEWENSGLNGLCSIFDDVRGLVEVTINVLLGVKVISNTFQKRQPHLSDNLKSFSNKYKLTPRHIEVIDLISLGLSSEKIGKRLKISANTVKNHKRKILKETGAKNTAQLIRLYVEHEMFKKK